MATIDKNTAPSINEIEEFSKQISFPLPGAFMEFYREANGADINSDEFYTTLWPLTDLIKLNKDYNVEECAPEFFIFGSNGGDTAPRWFKCSKRHLNLKWLQDESGKI